VQIKKIAHGKNIIGINIQIAAEHYLLHDVRLSQEEIIKLKNVLSGKEPVVND
jgi:predicted small secreted protein